MILNTIILVDIVSIVSLYLIINIAQHDLYVLLAVVI